jgi:hypothetical protein
MLIDNDLIQILTGPRLLRPFYLETTAIFNGKGLD